MKSVSISLSILILAISTLAWAAEPTSQEIKQTARWTTEHLKADANLLPFSFVYGGQSSRELLAGWGKTAKSKRLEKGRTQRTTTWTDAKSGLEVRCVSVEYSDFPVTEWTVYFKNNGPAATPILENVQGLDTVLKRGELGEFVLHRFKGDYCAPDGYQPIDDTLGPKANLRLAPSGGRGSNKEFPYYKLQTPEGGLILAVGWPGQWESVFSRDEGTELRLMAGQQQLHLSLKPGEEIRSPLMALLFWNGPDLIRAQNLWRSWMMAHNIPRMKDGKLPSPILFGNTSGEFNEMCNATEENQKFFLDRYQEEKIRIDYWWMDAGWYPCGPKKEWPLTGSWEPDTTRFPNGLRAISDHGHKGGIKTLVWFEPERVGWGDSWLAKNHPDWMLGGNLLNLGNPAALKWLIDHVDRTLTEQGIDLYRQDFNMDPLSNWRRGEAPDRQGLAENLHIQGYLAYWDELRRRHPGLLIDSCASGGRRNDLETMRRSVPLHPTDYNYADLPVKQAFHHTLFQWIPFFGSNTCPMDKVNPYVIRSGHGMGMTLGYDFRRKEVDYPQIRILTEEWRRIVPCYYGDFYPLTPFNRDQEKWIGWQFHRARENDGILELFRRAKSGETSGCFHLSGLSPSARYEVINADAGTVKKLSGKELMEQGLTVEIQETPGSALIVYKKR